MIWSAATCRRFGLYPLEKTTMHRTRLLSIAVALTGLLAWVSLAEEKAGRPKVDLKKMKATVERLQSPASLELKSTPLADVLKLIELYGERKFGWEYEILPDKDIDISVADQPLGEVLQKILDQCKWTYAVLPDGDILLRPVPQPKKK